MRNVSDKSLRKIKTHSLFSVTFIENHAVYEIKRKNIVGRGRPQMTIWRKRIACWTPKAIIHTHSGWIIRNTFPLQQLFYEGTSK
jgi:hypothetical protein